jgi:Golgi phosphoprotein 3
MESEPFLRDANVSCFEGETWNLMKIGYQLKQVRERLAKGLVDKGILRTEKRNFLLFDMATHPVADGGAKEELRRRVRNVLTQRTVVLAGNQFLPENLEFRYLRTLCMVCAAYAANVLENALSTLGHEARERAFAQTDELLADYSQWPFGKKATSNGIGANLPQVISEVRETASRGNWDGLRSSWEAAIIDANNLPQEISKAKDKELQLEVVAACLSVFTRLDSLL